MQQIFPTFLKPYAPMIEGVAIAIGILIIGWLASKIAEKWIVRVLGRAKIDAALGRFLGGIARYSVLAATLIAALGAVGIQTTSLVAIFASAGLAVGLALQGSLSNFASGVMILFFRPFTLGDVITAGGSTGAVHDIGIFTTTLLTPDNETVILPNKKVTDDRVVNHTVRGTRRGAVDVGVAYGSDVAIVIPLLEKAARSAELVLVDPAPAVAFVGLGASALDFKVLAWAKSADYLGMMHNVRKAVYDELNAAGIEIPYQQIVVHQAETSAKAA